MKAIVVVVVGFTILALSFGIYRWASDDKERARAEAAAEEFAAYCTRAANEKCEVSQLEQVAPDRWRFHFGPPGRANRCLLLDLNEFRATRKDSIYVGGNVEGVRDTPCRTDLWLPQDAASRVERSAWARDRKARFFSCAGRANERYAMYVDRFGCRFSSPRGDGYVVIRTTGPDTFEVESSD
jgi:hypothetical protein